MCIHTDTKNYYLKIETANQSLHFSKHKKSFRIFYGFNLYPQNWHIARSLPLATIQRQKNYSYSFTTCSKIYFY